MLSSSRDAASSFPSVSVLFNFKRSLWIITFIVQSRMIWLCKHNRHWHWHGTDDLHHTTILWATKQSTTAPNDHTKAYSISLSIEKKMKKFHLLHKILIFTKRVRDNFAATGMMSYLTPFLICYGIAYSDNTWPPNSKHSCISKNEELHLGCCHEVLNWSIDFPP